MMYKRWTNKCEIVFFENRYTSLPKSYINHTSHFKAYKYTAVILHAQLLS